MPPIRPESIIGLPDYKIISCQGLKTIEILAEYAGVLGCIHCGSVNLRKKERFNRVLKHHSIGLSKSVLMIQTYKFYCRDCKKYFNQRLPGVLPYQRSTEPFKDEVSLKHHDGTSVLKEPATSAPLLPHLSSLKKPEIKLKMIGLIRRSSLFILAKVF